MIYTESRTFDDNISVELFNYGTIPTITDKLNFVNIVTSIVLNENGYVPFLKPIAFNYALIQIFTDIDCYRFVNGENNFDIDRFADFDMKTNISTDLKVFISDELLEELTMSIDDNIAYKTGINKDSLSVALCELLHTLTNLVSSVNSSINSEKIMKFVDKMNDTDLNTESVVREYFNSDSFKNNVASTIGEKNDEIVKLKDRIAELRNISNE